MENISESIGDLTRSLANSGEEEKKSEQRFQLLLKDDERKDMKAAMFQYEKVMDLIVLNREQESTTSDPGYIEMLNDDFNTLKKRKN